MAIELPPDDDGNFMQSSSNSLLPPDVESEEDDATMCPVPPKKKLKKVPDVEHRPSQPASGFHEAESNGPSCVCSKVHTYQNDCLMEVFCPPRLVAEANRRGLRASVSLDQTTGWDANKTAEKQSGRILLATRKPWLLLVCPECRMFSILQRNVNVPKMDPTAVAHQMEEAIDHVAYSCELCVEQARSGRKFVFEHPSGASNWREEAIQNLLVEVPDARVISFAQCRYGLRAPDGRPMQKLTKFLTNSKAIIEEFAGRSCVCHLFDLQHAKIEGNMDGVKLSRHAQIYPPKLVRALVDCCQRELP